jgi:hypothetical protein
MTKTKKETISGSEGGSWKSSVNINIAIPEELHKKLKLAAIINNLTLKDFIIKSLEEATNGKR